MEMTIAEIREELAKGNRVLLLVRHAERPKIAAEDPTFGAELPLTPDGERMSLAFGRLLRGASDDVEFLASPLRRTILTAEFIASGMDIASPEIPTDDEIGNASAFVEDRIKVWKLFRDGGFFEKTLDYVHRGTQVGFNGLGAAAEAYEHHVLGKFHRRLGIFTTHDLFLVAYAHGRGIKTDFTAETWPRFLDSIAIIVEPGGKLRRAFVRAGLSDRYSGV